MTILKLILFFGMVAVTASPRQDTIINSCSLNTTGAVGLVPSYAILDLNASFRFTKNLELRLNINNLSDKQYFTKRPAFYPGPGVWPSEGRNFKGSFIFRLEAGHIIFNPYFF